MRHEAEYCRTCLYKQAVLIVGLRKLQITVSSLQSYIECMLHIVISTAGVFGWWSKSICIACSCHACFVSSHTVTATTSFVP